MTPSTIYWITRFDRFASFLGGIGSICVLLGFIALIGLVFSFCVREANREFGEDDRDFKSSSIAFRIAMKFLVGFGSVGVVSSLLLTFVPTTKELVAMQVVPRLASQENVQKMEGITTDMLDIASKWLKEVKEAKQ